MTLRKTYLFWLASLPVGIAMGILFYIGGMLREYGSLHGGGDFAGMGYFFAATIVIIFCTGACTALLARYAGKKDEYTKSLAANVFILHALFTLFFIAIFNYIFFFSNIYSVVSFTLLPFLAWNITTDKKPLRWLVFLGILIGIIILHAAFQYYILLNSGPGHATL